MTYDGAHAIAHGDVLAVLRELPSNEFDACLCDPPYGFSFMGKKWDYDVPSVDVWRELLRVLKPGAPLVSFGGTRTFHRVAVGIEDAGFELRDVLSWMYGSGFPKSLDVSKAIDKAAGAEREVVGFKRSGLSMNTQLNDDGWSAIGTGEAGKQTPVTAPSTPLAQQWAGYGTALKPAWEPAILARKPLEGTVAANVAKWGCGGLAIDACRIESSENLGGGAYSKGGRAGTLQGDTREGASLGMFEPGRTLSRNPICKSCGANAPYTDWDICESCLEAGKLTGRWPANVIMDEEAGAALDAQAGNRPGGRPVPAVTASSPLGGPAFGKGLGRIPYAGRNDDGGPSRFFYSAKVSTKEREWGCGELAMKSAAAMTDSEDGQARLDSPRTGHDKVGLEGLGRWPANVIMDEEAGAALDAQAGNRPAGWFSGATRKGLGFGSSSPKDEADGTKPSRSTGDSGGPSRFFYSSKVSTKEREWGCGELALKASSEIHGREQDSPGVLNPRAGAQGRGGARNHHPTLKPIALTRWLARLIMPPTTSQNVPQLIVPFSGAGSEMIGALQAGWPSVFGIEGEAEYVDIANARIAAWKKGSP